MEEVGVFVVHCALCRVAQALRLECSRDVMIPGVGVARSRLFSPFLGLQLRSRLLFSGVNSS